MSNEMICPACSATMKLKETKNLLVNEGERKANFYKCPSCGHEESAGVVQDNVSNNGRQLLRD